MPRPASSHVEIRIVDNEVQWTRSIFAMAYGSYFNRPAAKYALMSDPDSDTSWWQLVHPATETPSALVLRGPDFVMAESLQIGLRMVFEFLRMAEAAPRGC